MIAVKVYLSTDLMHSDLNIFFFKAYAHNGGALTICNLQSRLGYALGEREEKYPLR